MTYEKFMELAGKLKADGTLPPEQYHVTVMAAKYVFDLAAKEATAADEVAASAPEPEN